jgi:hypothetical protein
VTTFLVLFGLAAAWLASLYVKPFGRCFLCWGRGNIRRKGKRRAPKCWLCKGLGRRQRTGSRTVVRTVRHVTANWRWPG